jgi:hypothetical protein
MNFQWLFSGPKDTETELPEIYPMPILQSSFVEIDVRNTYARILTDALERTDGIPEEKQNLLWDNCLASEVQDGLVTLLAKAMTAKTDLFLVYVPAVNVLRKATAEETKQIRADYDKEGKSSTGIFITFKNYTRTDLVRFYSQMEYCTVAGLWKSSNISSAIQLKMSDLRSSTGLGDSGDVKAQAVALAAGLAKGRAVLIDGKDTIETATPDLTATNSAMEFISQKRSLYLGMPATYLLGDQSGGLGDSGKADSKAIDRGLKAYYFSIAKPVIEGLFEIKTTFKAEDFDGLDSALNMLKTFEITSDEYLSKDNKTELINKGFGLPKNSEGDPVEAVAVIPGIAPAPPTLAQPAKGAAS